VNVVDDAMIRKIGVTLVMLALASPSAAQPSKGILTPTDTCATFMAAQDKDSGDPLTVAALEAWAIGFLSGVAQSNSADILKGISVESAMNQINTACIRQPSSPVSSVVEEMAKILVTSQH
jgi:hypothetical protein